MSAPAYKMDWVTDRLAVGHAPMSSAHLDSIREQGVDAIINLCGEFCDLHEVEEQHGFEVYYLPLPDEESPDLSELEKALAWLDEAIYLGKRVLIHCRHGIGRTGTVLNAYLLRRGLGHKLAGQKLKKLRSKPANFDQWWTIRKYGKKSGRLTVRNPSLEMDNLVDLVPFFTDYEALAEHVEIKVREAGPEYGGCGEAHVRCCNTPIRISLLEAVYLSHHINLVLTSAQRLELIDRATAAARRESREEKLLAPGAGDYCLSDLGAQCPFLLDGHCQVYDYRPLQCRTFGLPEEVNEALWATLEPGLDKVSRDLFFAFTSSFSDASLPVFTLPDVASGRYVQACFHYMLKHGGAGGTG